ncbi:MAG: DUF5723 family protein [Bacteroidia bacterium]
MKQIYLLLCLSLICTFATAQNFLGYQNSNYAGVLGSHLQPASTADSRFKLDVSLFGFSTTFQNDYVGISKTYLTDGIFGGGFPEVDSTNKRLLFPEFLNGEPKSLYLNYDFYGPSLMFSLSNKHSISFTTRQRTIANIDNFGEEAARFAYDDVKIPSLWGTQYSSDNLGINVLSYLELGFGYSRVLMDKQSHFLKAGVKGKWLSGLAAAKLYTETLTYSFDDANTLNVHDVDAQYAHATVLDDIAGSFNPLTDFDRFSTQNTGFGWDFGVVYEWRPKVAEYTTVVGSDVRPRRDLNKYRARIGLSLLDVGSIRFDNSDFSSDFSGSLLNFRFREVEGNGVFAVDSTLAANFQFEPGVQRFRMTLPTVFSMQADVRITNNFYLNVTPHIALQRAGKTNGVHELNNISITPRFESKRIDVGVPFSYSDYGDWTLGTTVRVGPVVIGSRNLASFLINDDIRSLDIHAAVRFGLLQKQDKDKDGDGVPDKIDDCPKEAGPASNQGCPEQVLVETEPIEEVIEEPIVEEVVPEVIEEVVEEPVVEEVVPEVIEEVIEEPVVEEVVPEEVEEVVEEVVEEPVVEEVVPEVIEEVIEEPIVEEIVPEVVEEVIEEPVVEEVVPEVVEEVIEEPIVEEVVPEVIEEAIEEPVVEEVVPEVVEEVIEEPVVEEVVPELVEEVEIIKEIVEEAVVAEVIPEVIEEPVVEEVIVTPAPVARMAPRPYNEEGELGQYLPYADPDGDGVVNKDDKCPNVAGSAETDGCPEGDKRGIPDPTWDRLYFDSDKTYLPGKSRVILNKAVRHLQANPDENILIIGHADSDGSNPYNDALSRRRCEAAKAYLLLRGVSEDRLSIEHFGEKAPAATNASENGKQLNRRVELRMVKR